MQKIVLRVCTPHHPIEQLAIVNAVDSKPITYLYKHD